MLSFDVQIALLQQNLEPEKQIDVKTIEVITCMGVLSVDVLQMLLWFFSSKIWMWNYYWFYFYKNTSKLFYSSWMMGLIIKK